MMWNSIVKLLRGGKSTQERRDEGITDAASTSDGINSRGPRNRKVSTKSYDSTGALRDTRRADDGFTVQQAIETVGFGRFQLIMFFVVGIGWLADGMEMMAISIIGPAVHCQWMVPTWQQALLTSVVGVGMLTGSALFGKLADKYGRKTELFLSNVFVCYAGLLSAFSPNYLWLLCLRFFVGVGIGGGSQLATYYAEFLPMSTRATCLLLIFVFWTGGGCFVVAMSMAIMPTVGWRCLILVIAIPATIFIVLISWLPESPRYDIVRRTPDRAVATLERVARTNKTPMPRGKLHGTDVIAEAGEPVERGQVRDLFVPAWRVTTILLLCIWLVCGLAYYGVILMTTQLMELNNACYGGQKTEVVNVRCRLDCTMLSMNDYVELMFTTLSEYPGVLVTAFLAEKLGRRYTIALEMFVCGFFVLLVNICVSRVVLTIFLFIARGAAVGTFTAIFTYTPEVYPTTVRSLGLGTCNSFARVGAVITPFIAQVLLKQNVHAAVSVYTAFCVVAGIAALLLPIETKGRQMTDMNDDTSTR